MKQDVFFKIRRPLLAAMAISLTLIGGAGPATQSAAAPDLTRDASVEPRSDDSRRPPEEGRGFGPRRMGPDGVLLGGGMGRGGRMPDEVEGANIQNFVRTFMPNLGHAMWDEQVSPRQKAWLFGIATFQYRRYTKGIIEFAELQKMYEQDVRDNDDVVRLLQEYGYAGKERKQELRSEMRVKLVSLAENMLVERRRRIEKLKLELERQQTAVARDSDRLEKGVDTRMDDWIKLMSPAPRGSAAETSPATQPSGK